MYSSAPFYAATREPARFLWGRASGVITNAARLEYKMSDDLIEEMVDVLKTVDNGKVLIAMTRNPKLVEAWKYLKRANLDNLVSDLPTLQKLADDLAAVPTLAAKFDGNVGLVKAWERLIDRPTRTDIKYLNLFSDERTLAARTKLLDHPNLDFEALFPDLLQEELTAIHLYTTRVYIELNSALRAGGPLSPFHQSLKDVLSEALNKMPKYQGMYFRGTSVPQSVLDEYLAALPPGSGKTYFDAAFSSSSTVDTHISAFQNLAKKQGEIKIIITGNSSTGVYVDELSAYGKNFQTDPTKIQDEVLFKPNTKFEHFAEPIIFQNDKGETIYHFFMNEKTN